ncbi:MAG: phage holin family protein [Cyclobacteriaceae bacterium]|nr:phage holin family protein [Cyclobacteriaceae bacterium]
MTDPKNASRFEDLIEHLIGFLETKSEILKLELKEELVRIIAKLVSSLVIIILIALFFLFLSVAVGNFLNVLWQSEYLGYAALGGFFFLLWMVMLLLKRSTWYHQVIGYFTDKMLDTSKKEDEGTTEE